MRKTLITVAVGLAVGLGAEAQAVTIQWTTNLEAGNTAFPSSDPLNSAPFGSLTGALNPDVRMISSGSVSGGGEKAASAGVSWVFNGANQLATVIGSDVTPGGVIYGTNNGDESAAPAGDLGLFRNFDFLGISWGFVAPTVGSAAGLAYGAGVLSYGSSDAFTMHFATIESQWNTLINLWGRSNGGVTFNCTGAMTGAIECFAEVQLAYPDDGMGGAGLYAQWHLTGIAEPFAASGVPVPAAAWLMGSGLAALVGFARRRAGR